MKENTTYKHIFKSTFLFGFVQVFNIFTKVGLNKAAAVYLGAEGVGLIGIYQSMLGMLKTFFGFGISQSMVRDISKANADGPFNKLSTIITLTNKIVWFTALAGAVFTIVFSAYLSQLTFGNSDYTIVFVLLSVVVLLSILAEGQLSILKGMRQLRSLAKASVFGALAGLICGVPFYYFLGKDGIVPTMFVVALTAVVFSTYYVKKIKYEKIKLSLNEIIKQSSHMVKMGIVLMLVTFMGLLSEYVIKVYIANMSGLEIAGIYQAGLSVVSGYFGVFIVAMMTDYYPRVSAVCNDNVKLEEALDKQSKVGLVLIGPVVVAFMFLIPLFIELLYTKEFMPAVEFIAIAIFGTIIIVCSNPMDIILLAKRKAKIVLYASLFYRIVGISLSLYSYKYYGLFGLGVAAFLMGIFHLVLMQLIVYKLYKIHFRVSAVLMLFVTLFLAFIAYHVENFDGGLVKYCLAFILFLTSILYSKNHFEKMMGINLISVIKSKLIHRRG